jgi:ArsR family metal-binding transcriptional regulator
MDRYRMISIYARRIAVAKADDIVDAWRTLEAIRRRINDVWARRAQIEPSWELREKPPALEIFKRLPRTNCRACGELTCLAFAVKVWGGEAPPSHCRPVFTGEYRQLRDALTEICAGLGVEEGLVAIGKERQ